MSSTAQIVSAAYPQAVRVGRPYSPKTPDFRVAGIRQRSSLSLGNFSAIGWLHRNVGRALNDTAELRTGESALAVRPGFASGMAPIGAVSDASFDVVTSAFTVQFAPDIERAAAELVRVCRPGGRIGLACWTPDGFVGQLTAVARRYLPESTEVQAPILWGTRRNLDAYFGHHAMALAAEDCRYTFRYASADEWLSSWRGAGGPLQQAFRQVDPDWREQFAAELKDLALRCNRAADGRLVIDAEYLRFLVHRKEARPQ